MKIYEKYLIEAERSFLATRSPLAGRRMDLPAGPSSTQVELYLLSALDNLSNKADEMLRACAKDKQTVNKIRVIKKKIAELEKVISKQLK